MALLRFFKTPKHQRYDYKPRFWDPEKEEREKRLKFLDEIKKDGIEASKARIQSGFRRKGLGANKAYRRRQMQKSNIILIIVIFVLLFITYVFLKVYLPEIVSAVEGIDK